MANLTISIDEETLRKARIRALQQGTSINALLRDYLTVYCAGDHIHATTRAGLEHAEQNSADSGPGGREWTREDLYER